MLTNRRPAFLHDSDPATHDASTLPRRGEKDFEPHGTNAQIATLTASRAAMHAALSRSRMHPPSKSASAPLAGTYTPSPSPQPERTERKKGLRLAPPEYSAVVQSPKGPHFRTVGKVGPDGLMRLLPEEALYLLERGSLDLRWPAAADEGEDDNDGDRSEQDAPPPEPPAGLPLSLQAAYACLMGRGGLTLERYAVYAGLKRTGYIVQRGPAWDVRDDLDLDDGGAAGKAADASTQQRLEEKPVAQFAWLYRFIFGSSQTDPAPRGPLVPPGLYRSYSTSRATRYPHTPTTSVGCANRSIR